MSAAETRVHYETRLVRIACAAARWARRRSVRASIADTFDDETRRAILEERMLLEEERAIALRELERTNKMITLYRGI